MDSKIRIMTGSLLFLAYSCGWLEEENINEIQLSQGYILYYDTSNVAYNAISLVSKEGVPLLNDCEELYLKNGYLYAKVSKGNGDYEYYKINNISKKTSLIKIEEYLKDIEYLKVIRYKEMGDFSR